MSAAEVLGLPGERKQLVWALPLILASWLALALVVSFPLLGLATLCAAPLLVKSRRPS